MKILYIHGLGSSKFSETPKRLREALPEAEVLSPEIPIDPIEAVWFLEDNFLNDTSIDLVVGSSLGGFYSLLLKHHRKLLANPALFADEDIEKGIGLGEQGFLSPRENGAKTYVIDEAFIRSLAKIRDKIFNSDPSRPGMPDQEQIENTWAIFAKSDELLAHHDDFCHLFRPDHAFRMKGEHRVSEDNMRKDIVPLIKRILKTMDGNMYYITKACEDGSDEVVMKIKGTEKQAREAFMKVILEQSEEYHIKKTLKKWRVIKLFDESGKQIGQES